MRKRARELAAGDRFLLTGNIREVVTNTPHPDSDAYRLVEHLGPTGRDAQRTVMQNDSWVDSYAPGGA